MRRKNTEKEENENMEFNFGLGKLSFGGLFKGVGNVIDLIEKMEREGKSEVRREGRIGGIGRKDVRGVYGFNIKLGLGRKAHIEPFGNIRETKRGVRVVGTREPIVDVFNEKEHILIVTELPGIDEKSINLDLKKDILFLEAGSDDRKYAKEILLPAKVDFASKEVHFKNGILEIQLNKSINPFKKSASKNRARQIRRRRKGKKKK